MTKYYLLYNANCPKCKRIAQIIINASSDKLKGIDIHSLEAINWLNQVYPKGWKSSPYLVLVRGDKISACTNSQFIMRIFMLLGVRKSWMIWHQSQRISEKGVEKLSSS